MIYDIDMRVLFNISSIDSPLVILPPPVLMSPKSQFRSLFNYSAASQKQGSDSLKGLRGRAGFGESKRSKQRKLVITNEKGIEAANSVSVSRLLERQWEQIAIAQNIGNSLTAEKNIIPPMTVEPRAVLLPAEEIKIKIAKAINDLDFRLKSVRTRNAEGIEGQWRKRHEIVLGYLSFQQRFPHITATEGSIVTAAVFKRGGWVARRLREWTDSWVENRLIPKGEQGIGRRMSSWYEDEKLELFMRKFIAEMGATMTAQKLSTAVGNYLMSEDHGAAVLQDLQHATVEEGEEDGTRRGLYKRKGIRARSACRWLRRMGYRYRDIRKGIFLDGHERSDVIEYRQIFVRTISDLESLIVEYDINGNMIEKSPMPGERLCVLMAHDESTFSANDARRQAWHNIKQTHLRPKSRGRGIMLSDILYANGRVCVPDSITAEQMIAKGLDPERRFATEYFEYGKNNSGYWTGEHVVDHILKIVIPMFELSYSAELYQGLFLFDNAAGYGSFASDALRAQDMNLDSGGKAPIMRNSYFTKDFILHQQQMNFPHDHPIHPGKPKGLRIILTERGLWNNNLRLDCSTKSCIDCKEIVKQRQKLSKSIVCTKDLIQCAPRKRCQQCISQINTIPITKGCQHCKSLREHQANNLDSGCCARRIMSLQPDFIEQKGRLQEEIEAKGH